MESYGELLRTARENKKLTLEAVERETSISKEYLEALENEIMLSILNLILND